MKKMLLLSRMVISSSLFADNVATPALTSAPQDVIKPITNEDLKTCTSCHGIDFEKSAVGKSKIVKDMSEEEISKALKGYKDDSYGGVMKNIMKPQVSKHSDKNLEEMAKIIKTPKTVPTK